MIDQGRRRKNEEARQKVRSRIQKRIDTENYEFIPAKKQIGLDLGFRIAVRYGSFRLLFHCGTSLLSHDDPTVAVVVLVLLGGHILLKINAQHPLDLLLTGTADGKPIVLDGFLDAGEVPFPRRCWEYIRSHLHRFRPYRIRPGCSDSERG